MGYAPAPTGRKPHAVCLPFPAQGHINPMLKLAMLLYHRGFHITFVNTDHNHKRLLKSRGPNYLDGLPDFCFKTIVDGLPPTDLNATQDIPSLCDSTSKYCLVPFRLLLAKLNGTSLSDVPPVTCIISDAIMTFSLIAAKEIGVPGVLFRTTSTCSFLCNKHTHLLIERCLVPLRDSSYLRNGYLDTVIDWIPGMKGIRLRDFPSFIRTTDPNDLLMDFMVGETDRCSLASAVIFNTFDALEHYVIDALLSMCPPIYSMGPLHLLVNQLPQSSLESVGSSLWKEEPECLQWLNSKKSNSVVYVNFGSITVMTREQLIELAWGIANSKKNFLWIIRDDLVVGDSASAILTPAFIDETRERGLISRWCPQESAQAPQAPIYWRVLDTLWVELYH